MKIAIDIDDTLTKIDRVTAVEKYLKENGLPFRVTDPDAHALSGLCDWSISDVTKFITGGGDRLFRKAAGHEIVILTARIPEWFSDPERDSRNQLDRCGIPYDRVVANVWEKGEYCVQHGIEVLIEDNFEICKKAQELGVKAVMFVDKHNLSAAKQIRYAGSNWEHIASAVEYILDPPPARR